MSDPSPSIDPERTRWSRINDRDYDHLVRRYWKPIRRFMIGRLKSIEDAEEVTQDVFLAFVQKDLLDRASERRGPFRRFLFHVARQVLYDRYRHDHARQRDADRTVPLGDGFDLGDRGSPPEESFDREWYLSLFNRAIEQLKEHYRQRDREVVFRSFKTFYFPQRKSGPRPTRSEVARSLGLTEDQVRNHVHRSKKVFVEKVLAEIGEYCSSEDEVQQELDEMIRFLDQYLEGPLPDSKVLLLEPDEPEPPVAT